MLSQTKFYNFKQNIITVGAFRIRGFGAEGGVEYEFGDDIHRRLNSADGQTVVSRVNDNDVMATFTLHEASKGFSRLMSLLQLQLQNPMGLVELPYVHTDPIIGDLITSTHTVFMQWPQPNKGREAGEREIQVLLPGAAENMVLGSNN